MLPVSSTGTRAVTSVDSPAESSRGTTITVAATITGVHPTKVNLAGLKNGVLFHEIRGKPGSTGFYENEGLSGLFGAFSTVLIKERQKKVQFFCSIIFGLPKPERHSLQIYK